MAATRGSEVCQPEQSKRCPATLRQAHGVTPCDLDAGHEDNKHKGMCDLCWEDDDYPVLTWEGDEGRTEWPI
jgi:hypothetical protein